MRIHYIALSFLLLLGLVGSALASDPPQAGPGGNLFQAQPPADNATGAFRRGPPLLSADQPFPFRVVDVMPLATCYTMRTYVVARDREDTDATHRVKYVTCTPSNRVQMKSALETSGAK